MIGALHGILLGRDNESEILVDVRGVGYVVTVVPSLSATLGEVGTEVRLRVHTRVREDAITLFGFADVESLRCFESLVATHGVGPSLAMSILAVYSPSALQTIVFEQNATALSKVPGVGKKTAERLLVELKSRFGDVVLDLDASSSAPLSEASSAKGDVAAALAELGYSPDEIRDVLRLLPTDGSVEALLRVALRELAVHA